MKKQSTARFVILLVLSVSALCVAFLISVNLGGLSCSLSQLLRGLFIEYDETVAVILELRFPRVISSMLGGALMALSGVLMQAVMRNPLADPGIIGVTSGAATAAVAVSSFFPSLALLTPIFSFFGGMLAFAAVYLLSSSRECSPVRMILTGIAVDAFFTGAYSAMSSAVGGSYSGAAAIVNASVSLNTWSDVRILGVCLLITALLCMLGAARCDLLSLSDSVVTSLGVNVRRTRLLISLLSVFAASAFTSTVGSVSFLGLVVPHIARLLVGSSHKRLLPYSAVLGALVLLVADTVGRTVAYPYEISPSVIMSLIGGPVFIILLKRRSGAYGD